MIHDKITPELIKSFSTAIKSTRTTGQEQGFHIFKDRHGNLSPGKTFYGEEESLQLESPQEVCYGARIQGDFHTHVFVKPLRKAIRENTGKRPSINEIRDVAIELMIWRYEEKGIKEEMSLNTPTYDDALKAILCKHENITNGMMSIGNDLDEDNVEFWTVKENITDKDYRKALNELGRRYKREKSGESNSQAMEKWIISLFEKETIDLRN